MTVAGLQADACREQQARSRSCLNKVTLEELEKRLAAVEKSLEADGEGQRRVLSKA